MGRIRDYWSIDVGKLFVTTAILSVAFFVAGESDTGDEVATFYDSKYHDDGRDSKAMESMQPPVIAPLDANYFDTVPDKDYSSFGSKIIFEKGTAQEFHDASPIGQPFGDIQQDSLKSLELSSTSETSSYFPIPTAETSSYFPSPSEEPSSYLPSPTPSGSSLTDYSEINNQEDWVPNTDPFFESEPESGPVFTKPVSVSSSVKWPADEKPGKIQVLQKDVDIIPQFYGFVDPILNLQEIQPIPSPSSAPASPPQHYTGRPTILEPHQDIEASPISEDSVPTNSYFDPQPALPEYRNYVYYPVQAVPQYQQPLQNYLSQSIGSYFSSLSSIIKRLPKAIPLFSGGISYVYSNNPNSLVPPHFNGPSVPESNSAPPQITSGGDVTEYISRPSGDTAYSKPHQSYKFTPSPGFTPGLPSAYFDNEQNPNYPESFMPSPYSPQPTEYGPPGYNYGKPDRESRRRPSEYGPPQGPQDNPRPITPSIPSMHPSITHHHGDFPPLAIGYKTKEPSNSLFSLYSAGQEFDQELPIDLEPQKEPLSQYGKPLNSYYTTPQEYNAMLNGENPTPLTSSTFSSHPPNVYNGQKSSIFDDFMTDFMSYYRGMYNKPKNNYQMPYGSYKKPGSVSDEFMYSAQNAYGTPKDLTTPTTLGYYRTPYGSWARMPITKGVVKGYNYKYRTTDQLPDPYRDDLYKYPKATREKIALFDDFDDRELNCENSHHCKKDEELHNLAETVDLTRGPKPIGMYKSGMFQKLMGNSVKKRRRPLPPTPPPQHPRLKKTKRGRTRRGRRRRCRRQRKRCLFF